MNFALSDADLDHVNGGRFSDPGTPVGSDHKHCANGTVSGGDPGTYGNGATCAITWVEAINIFASIPRSK